MSAPISQKFREIIEVNKPNKPRGYGPTDWDRPSMAPSPRATP